MTVFPLGDAMQQKNNTFSPLELGHPKKRDGVLHIYFSLGQLPSLSNRRRRKRAMGLCWKNLFTLERPRVRDFLKVIIGDFAAVLWIQKSKMTR